MKLLEYQGRKLFIDYGIPAPEGEVAESIEQIKTISEKLGFPVVIKAQVLVGGRGKAGGVKVAKNLDELQNHATSILGMDIKGERVKKVLITKAVDIAKELYLSITLDRSTKKYMFIASEAGGVDIEEIAAKTPERISKSPIDPLIGYKGFIPFKLFSKMELSKDQLKILGKICQKMFQIFLEKDCSLVEINPLAILKDDSIMALDSKVIIEDNGLYRQKDLKEYQEENTESENDSIAREYGLSYVGLDGNVGCMVNGAGLAMATMDVIKLYGGEPANFLDVGGSSNPVKVIQALKIITSNKNVKSILINIFGGITRCDDIANGILQALSQMNITLPIIVRLTGTNEKEAMELLANTNILSYSTMDEAVKKAVELTAS